MTENKAEVGDGAIGHRIGRISHQQSKRAKLDQTKNGKIEQK
jgi:hypothetical protein